MAVNMSGIDKNPFRVGDMVRVKAHILRTWSSIFSKYIPVEFAIVTRIVNNHVLTDVDSDPAHFEHFELYKEPEETMNQQTQQKTNRVRFTHELWEKWKDKGGKVIYVPTGEQVMQLAYFPEADHRYRYVYLTTPGTVTSMGTCDPLDIEIPVTTKRIPFNPELKDAKVFIERGDCPVKEWYVFSNGVVAVLPETSSYLTAKDQSELEMEIEEDV